MENNRSPAVKVIAALEEQVRALKNESLEKGMSEVKPKTDTKNAKVALMQSAKETAAKQGKLRVTHAKK